MAKTSYILLIIVFLCSATFLYIKYLSPSPHKSTQQKTITSQEKPELQAKGKLFLSPELQSVAAGQQSIVDVNLQTENATPTILQFEIAYNPNVVTPISIIPGKYFDRPIVLLNQINPRNGRISYALKCSDTSTVCGNKATKQVAQIVFIANALEGRQPTTLKIMPKTILETKEAVTVDLQTSDAKITLQGAVVLQASPSAFINP